MVTRTPSAQSRAGTRQGKISISYVCYFPSDSLCLRTKLQREGEACSESEPEPEPEPEPGGHVPATPRSMSHLKISRKRDMERWGHKAFSCVSKLSHSPSSRRGLKRKRKNLATNYWPIIAAD